MNSAHDVPLLIRSENSASERRISPAWSISHLKGRLEPITGIPAGCQRLALKIGSQPAQPIQAADEDATQLAQWPLQAYAEVVVTDTRPPGARTNYTDVSAVPKFELPLEAYESRTDSVLAWKKSQKLGRFDPSAPSDLQQKIDSSYQAIRSRGIEVGKRCRLLPADADARRGEVAYVGEVEEIKGQVGAWVGVRLDEPTGRNDGSVGGDEGRRYFDAGGEKRGVFVRPERVEVGEFPVVDEFADEDDEEF